MARADYYVGYPVLAISTPHKTRDKGKWKWALMLEGGSVIRIYTDRFGVPKESVLAGDNKFLMSVVNNADGTIELVVGKPNMLPHHPPIEIERFKLGMAEYSVIDGRDDSVEWFPLNEHVARELPPEPSERLQDGPQEPDETEEG